MVKFADLKLGHKLGLAFACVVALTLATGGFAASQLARINASTEDLATNALPSIKVLGQMGRIAVELRLSESQLTQAADSTAAAAGERRFADRQARLQTLQSTYEPLLEPGAESDGYVRFKQRRADFLAAHQRLLQLVQAGASLDDRVAAFAGDSQRAFDAMTATLDELTDINDKAAAQSYADAHSTYVRAFAWVAGIVLCAALVAAALALWITRLVVGPMARAVAATRHMAAGNLCVPLPAASGGQDVDSGGDETRQLLRGLAAMQDSFAHIVRGVRAGADGVATASVQIAHGNADLSQRTEQQASALQQTAATMDELGSTVRHTAANAQQVNTLAREATAIAREGGGVVGQVVQTMQDIDGSSKRIADITAVIDGIAFQTNILALNAAVEAARAGEQGRGFAVVASEVRSLAQRSAAAAREIKTLIGSSVAQVEHGSALVGRAGQTMDRVVEAIGRVSTMVAEITAASGEQSIGVGQVGQAMAQMDRTTQQNAALVEQSAAAAESLKTQAQQLVRAVSVFQLDGQAA